MKRLALLFAGGAVWLLLAAVPVFADAGPHTLNGANVVADTCASCHRTHTAKAAQLLPQSGQAFCYTCHGTTGAGARTDVASGFAYNLITRDGTTPIEGALRGGGFVNARIVSGSPTGQTNLRSAPAGNVPALANGTLAVPVPGVAVTSTHQVDGLTAMVWGKGAISTTAVPGTSILMTCSSCHDPHGNGNYRILRPNPQETAGAAAVPIADETTKVYTTMNYWAVAAGTPSTFIANASAWCATCHTRYKAAGGSGATSSTDAIFTYRHATDQANPGGPNCVQCHVAHGSNAVQGTASNADPGGTAAVASSRLLRIDNRGTCQMCHNR